MKRFKVSFKKCLGPNICYIKVYTLKLDFGIQSLKVLEGKLMPLPHIKQCTPEFLRKHLLI